MWTLFYAILRQVYLHYKAEIKKGNKWVLRMSYTFCYGLMIKTHESMFGLLCYALLMQFSCLTFTNVLGVFSFMAAIIMLAYLFYNTTSIYYKLNG
jgi:hypothetical protein